MSYLEFAFISFWHFVGVALLLGGLGNFILLMWNRFWRHWNIRKHGYPPPHCDADGDFG
jgi:D-alanyl-lipoteichoic acid acyltransferase DltB (MBOAT superfamily)